MNWRTPPTNQPTNPYWLFLAVIPCPKKTATRLKCLLLWSLWKGQVLLLRKSIYCQHPQHGGFGMPSLMMQHHSLRLLHLQKHLNHCNDVNENKGELIWGIFLQLISLRELPSWVKCRPRLGIWHLDVARHSLHCTSCWKSLAGKQPKVSIGGWLRVWLMMVWDWT